MAWAWIAPAYLSVRRRGRLVAGRTPTAAGTGCARHLHRRGAMRTTDEALRVVNQRPLVGAARRADAGARGRADVAFLVLRLVAGLALALAHGINKLPPTDRF